MENELLKEEPCNISKQVAKLVEQADGYYYIYKEHYLSKKSDGIYTYWYYCSQCQQLAKKPRKNEDLNKQRDREYIKHFDCNGLITISINMNTFLVTIHLKHDILHKRPERCAVSDTIKEKIKQYINFTPKDIFRQLEQENPDLTQKQVHAWWANFIKQEYIRDKNNQLKSAKLLLEEYNYEIILVNIEDKTNALGFELYSVIGQSDGAGFALAYLLLDSTKKNDDLRPKIIELLETLLHRHPLIPNCAGEFLSKEDIWKLSVQEIYEFCFKYDL
ncbi:unnamed protein product [Rhizophagus irregularis]|nr:unnamed protein product [Rhizophagus irregularis]